MSELGDTKAGNTVSSGNSWRVDRQGAGYEVTITRRDGTGYFGTDVADPATDAIRDEAKDRLLDAATHDEEMEAIEAAFAAPWVQA